MESAGLDVKMEHLLLANVCPVPQAATFSKETIDRDYGPCTDWTRADLILDAIEKVDEQPQPQTSANSSSHLAPPIDVEYDHEYSEDEAVKILEYLTMFMEKLLPDLKEKYFLRGAGYRLMAEITLEIERGQMDDELWDHRSIEVLRVLEQMYESKDFPRGFVLF